MRFKNGLAYIWKGSPDFASGILCQKGGGI